MKLAATLFVVGLLLATGSAVTAAEAGEADAVPEMLGSVSQASAEPATDSPGLDCGIDVSASAAARDAEAAAPLCGSCSYDTSCQGASWGQTCYLGGPGSYWGTCHPVGSLTCSTGGYRCRCYDIIP